MSATGSVPIMSLGQTGYRFELGSTVVYIDPYLSNSVQETEGDDLERLMPIPIQPGNIADAQFVLITHEHLDHCDPATLLPMSQSSPQCMFVGPWSVKEILLEHGMANERIISAGRERIDIGDVRLDIVPSAHPTIETDNSGNSRFVGYVIHFQGRKFYHAGDTSVDERILNELRQVGAIDVAFLPVNEKNFYRDQRGIIGNMSVREAFQFAVDMGARTLVPTHWDMFAANSVFREEIELCYQKLAPDFELVINPEYI